MEEKILLVDNMTYIRLTMKKILEKSGFKIIGEARDSIETRLKYRLLSPDLVIMEINIRGVEQLISSIIAYDKNAKIIISGTEDDILNRRIKKPQVMGHIFKPIKEEDLLSVVKEVIASEPPGEQLPEIEVPDTDSQTSPRTIPPPEFLEEVPLPQPDHSMDVRFVTPIIDAIVEVLSELTGSSIGKGKLFYLRMGMTTMGVGAIINISGHVRGKIMLDMTRKTACIMASRLFGEEITEYGRLVEDLLGEIVNNISGRAITKLTNYGYGKFSISLPEVITENIIRKDSLIKKIMIVPLEMENDLISVNFFMG